MRPPPLLLGLPVVAVAVATAIRLPSHRSSSNAGGALLSWLSAPPPSSPLCTRRRPQSQHLRMANQQQQPQQMGLLAFTPPSSTSGGSMPFSGPSPAATGVTPFPTAPEATLLSPFTRSGGGHTPPPADPTWWPFGGDGQQPQPLLELEPPAPLPEEEEEETTEEGGPVLAPRVYMFTKYPQPGRAKTRMIPALGSQGATILHRRLVRQTLETLDVFRRESGVDCRVRYDGAEDVNAMMGWLGLDWVYESQGPGDLGQRMARATALADGGEEGVGAVVIVGSDCPFVTPGHLAAAVEALGGSEGQEGEAAAPYDVVLGPAADGGYWLIGLRRPCPALFECVAEWGSDRVLQQTLEAAERLGLRVKLLETLADLDRPADLALWSPPPLTSVIIPVLNEAGNLPATLASIYNGTLVPSSSSSASAMTGSSGKKQQRRKRNRHAAVTGQMQQISSPAQTNVEVIVVDGGSSDESKAIALALGARVLSSPVAHRAKQLNLGAAAASGDVLLFLHADTRLPPHWEAEVRAALKDPRTLATAFRLRIAAKGAVFRFLEAAVALRSTWPLRMPYGDQGLALRREAFEKLGGYQETLPVMEDFALIRALHRRLRAEGRQGRVAVSGGSGPAVQLLPSAVSTSARRWERLGVVKTTVVNQLMVLGFVLGVDPGKLAGFYRQQQQGEGVGAVDGGKGKGGGGRKVSPPPLERRGGGVSGDGGGGGEEEEREEEMARAFATLAPLVALQSKGW